ncbi:10373_t:CDS:2 [Paraglomus brasilianum]|uniref:tRNA (adenine(58)-N(1))-methyltransferase catalytic subunit TRM61 n=1 Tax=Paraglomus brasilianum TaxID=144538 RepID=A0A9N9FAC6_9GLOM|nr:10373_t:CDS:2 [Paraglomus brasilianum]
MDFINYKKYIEENDLVIAFVKREPPFLLKVDSKASYNNKFGNFKHSNIIGKEYGSRIPSHNQKAYMYLLYPTPELWTMVLPHRTQILYMPDIAFITTVLDLKPGSIVLESGTGSGSFSHSIARTIAPHGHLYTYEFHEERAKFARQEFSDHGLGNIISIECRDVCKNGFNIENCVNAVFLDLPAPWEAIASAKAAFKQNQIGKICCFSPCLEQVQRTCVVLNEAGFSEIQMFECLVRTHDVHTIPVYTISDAVAKLKVQQAKKRKRVSDDEDREMVPEQSKQEGKSDPPNLYVSRTTRETKGHTSYLTFATFLPVLNEELDAP